MGIAKHVFMHGYLTGGEESGYGAEGLYVNKQYVRRHAKMCLLETRRDLVKSVGFQGRKSFSRHSSQSKYMHKQTINVNIVTKQLHVRQRSHC